MKDKKVAFVRIALAFLLFAVSFNALAQESGLSDDGTERWQIVHYPSLPPADHGIESIKTNTADMIKKCWQVYDLKNNVRKKAVDVIVFDDRLEIQYNKRQTAILNFSDILDQSISLKKWEFVNNKFMYNPYIIKLNEIMFTYDPNQLAQAKKLADCLFYFQHLLNEKRFSSQLAVFEPLAAQYRALTVKPVVSERQREFIVKANLFSQQKNYAKAVELYNKVIEVDQTAYTAAYSNLALLWAELHMFDAAVFNMKKYLLLEPAAADARSAQDKIYEWSAMISQ